MNQSMVPMHITSNRSGAKVKPNQGFDQGASAETSEDVLMKEFSETLDKIAAQVARNQGSALPDVASANAQLFRASKPAKEAPAKDDGRRDISAPTRSAVASDAKPEATKSPAAADKKEVHVESDDSKKSKDEPASSAAAPQEAEKADSKVEDSTEEVSKETQSDVASAAAVVSTGQLPAEIVADASKSSQEEVAPEKVASEVTEDTEEVVEDQKAPLPSEQSPEGKIEEKVDAAPINKAPMHKAEEEKTTPDASVKVANTPIEEVPVDAASAGVSAVKEEGEVIHSETVKAFEGALKDTLAEIAKSTLGEQMMGPVQNAEILISSTVLRHFMESPIKGDTTTQFAKPQAMIVQPMQLTDASSSLKGGDLSSKSEFAKAVRPIPRPLEARTMERVESALKEVARSKDGKTISLRLDPPSLGTVKIDVSYRNGALHARLVAESPQITSLLREKSSELAQLLRKAGIEAERINVSVSSEGKEEELKKFDSGAQSGRKNREDRAGDNSYSGVPSGSATIQMNEVAVDHWVA